MINFFPDSVRRDRFDLALGRPLERDQITIYTQDSFELDADRDDTLRIDGIVARNAYPKRQSIYVWHYRAT